MTEEYLLDVALRGARLYAAEHPRPTQVNATQAAEMLSISPQTVRKMIRDGRLPLNKCGLIPIIEIDYARITKEKTADLLQEKINAQTTEIKKEKEIVVLPNTKITNDFTDFMESIRGAKRRASRKGRDCELTREIAVDLWTRCRGFCEVTGIKFDFTRLQDQKLRPYAPSIDRINNQKGYTAENSRVVCVAVNLAMNQWGEHVLRKIAQSFHAKEGTR